MEDEIGTDTPAKVFECDDELRKQSNGDNFFVSYANATKIKTFKTEAEANLFVKGLSSEIDMTLWVVVWKGIPQIAFKEEIDCERYLVKEGTSMKILDEEDHDGDWEYYNINLETE